jgi:hypothetical protein
VTWDELTGLEPGQVVFWSGAGISADAPTHGPLGNTLTRRALAAYFEDEVYDTLQELYRRIDAPNAAYRPRLETVLDVAVGHYGLDILADALSDLVAAVPNANHAFFGAHAAAGGHHVTANFDTCVERAGANVDGRVFHIHGSLREPGQPGQSALATLGARLGLLENGFPEETAARLDDLLGSAAVRAVVFVGYSGSDFFDVTPYFRRRGARLLAGRTVVWLTYSPTAQPARWAADATAGYLPLFRDAGARVLELTGPLVQLCDRLTRAWQLELVPVSSAPGATWQRQMTPTQDMRASATAALYSRMGVRGRVIAALEGKPELSPSEHAMLADAYWGAGRYRRCWEQWRAAKPGIDPDTRASLRVDEGAILWIRGRLVAAERYLRRALDDLVSPHSPIEPAIQLQLTETYARVLLHMQRLPDVRRRARPEYTARAEQELRRLRDLLAGRLGVQLTARAESAQANLAATNTTESMNDHAAGMEESEALHGWLNYTHGRYRQQAADAAVTGRANPLTPADYHQLRERQLAVGATGDAARVALLPGAAVAFSPWQVAGDLIRVDFTCWHRLRLLVGFTTAWPEFGHFVSALPASASRRVFRSRLISGGKVWTTSLIAMVAERSGRS